MGKGVESCGDSSPMHLTGMLGDTDTDMTILTWGTTTTVATCRCGWDKSLQQCRSLDTGSEICGVHGGTWGCLGHQQQGISRLTHYAWLI